MRARGLNFFHNRFPDYDEPNVRWFYIVTALMNAWFQIGNWLLYVLLYMATGTFAIYEAVAFGIGILVEIPSGAFADLFGRKRTVNIATFMQAIGSVIFTLGFLHNALFFFGNLLIIVSFAFRSGSQEALVYDTLVESNKTEHFDDIVGKARSLQSLSIVVASILGGIAWTIGVYLPWALSSAVFIIGFLASLKYREPDVELNLPSIKSFLAQNRRGFHYLFKSDFRKYTFSLAMITGSFLMWHTGIIRALMGRDFGYDGQSINYLIAVTSTMGFLVAFNFHRIRKWLGDLRGFSLMLLISVVAWIITGLVTRSLFIGFLVFTGITLSGILAELWTSVILNRHIHSKDRATAISTLSFLVQIPYVLVVILFGQLVESGKAAPFYIITGVLLALGLLSFYRAEHSKVIVEE
jgi:MFS family permease